MIMKKKRAASKKYPLKSAKKLDFVCSTATTEPCGFDRNKSNGNNVEFSTILEKDNKMIKELAGRKKTSMTTEKTDNKKTSKLEETIKILSQKNNGSSTAPCSSKELTINIKKLKESCQKKVAESNDHFENETEEVNNEQPIRKQSPSHPNLRSKKGAFCPAILEVDAAKKSTKINKQPEKKTKRKSILDDATENLTKINKERKKETERKSGGPSILDDKSPGVKRKRGRPKKITPQLVPAKPSSKNNEVTNEDSDSDSASDSIVETNSICGRAKSGFIDTINDKGQIKKIRFDRGPLQYIPAKGGNWSCAISSISSEKCAILHFKIQPKKSKETCMLDRKYVMRFTIICGSGQFMNGKELIKIKENSEVLVLGGSKFCIINNSEETMILNCARTLKSKEILPNRITKML